MVLYHASTMYHLLCCIVHRLAYNSNEEAQLLLTEYIKPDNERAEFVEKLNKYKFFESIRYVPEQKIKLKKGIVLDKNSTEKQINTVIDNICRAFEDWFGDDMRKFSKIYVAADQHSCGIYLISNKIPYIYMEDASGMLSELDRYLAITKSNNLTNHIINEYLGGAGRGDCVVAKLCDLKHQLPDFYDEKAVDFSIYDTLKNVIPDKIQSLIEYFGNLHSTIKSDKPICLFLTQDMNTLAIRNIDLQELMTTTLIDYLCPNHYIVVKPHPKDRWQNYKRFLPDSLILPRSVPSELLPFAIDGCFDVALTASSTSIRGVTEFAKNIYSFTTFIETNRNMIDDMYVITEVLKYLGIKQGVSLKNIPTHMISKFLRNAQIEMNDGNVIINGGQKGRQEEELSNTKTSVFMNLGHILNYNPTWKNDNLYMIKANFEPCFSSLMSRKEIVMLINTTDKKLKEELSALNLSQHLKYTKADVSVVCTKVTDEMSKRLSEKLIQDIEWEDNENE